MAEHFAVQPLLVVAHRHAVDRVHVERRDHRVRPQVAEQRDFSPFVVGDRAVGTADQHVRLDADVQQFLHRMLRRLGLQLAGRLDVRHQRQMHEHRPLRPQLVAELADRFQERQALDVADGAADLDQREIHRPAAVVQRLPGDRVLDRVGDVRDHLHGRAEIVAAPLLGDHLGIDAPGGGVVVLARVNAGKTLVMAEVEVGFRPVVGDEHLAVLVRAHRARIDVQIGVQLAQPHRIAARLQQRAEGGRCDAFAKRGNHAAGDENEPRHGPPI